MVERFADYWNKDAVAFDEIVYLPMPDSTVRLNNLLSGQLDIMERIATSDLERLEGNDAVKVVGSPASATSISSSTSRAPTRSPRTPSQARRWMRPSIGTF